MILQKETINTLKQKIKMIDEASTIGKVGEDAFGNSHVYLNNIVTDLRKPTNIIKQIDIRNPDITITTTKNNVVESEYTNSKISLLEPEPYNSFPLGKIVKLEKNICEKKIIFI